MAGPYYIGIDVGTGSARAALVTATGDIILSSTQEINMWEPRPGFFEQSSTNIWNACVKVIKNVVSEVHDKSNIHGIGFDATCSLVVLDKDFNPLSVSPTGDDEQNIVMWMDHRAEKQADAINSTNHPVLKYVGGKQSLEMQTPKLLWIKQNMLEKCWNKACHFLDLGDFLTWKATGSLTRSLCSLVCKCTYIAGKGKVEDGHWDDSFFTAVGLEDLVQEGYTRLGVEVKAPGEPCGNGLSSEAAKELGLNPGTAVGMAIIDAHAGGIATLGCEALAAPMSEKLPLILGTSSCFMAVSNEELFVPGVWGPYYSAMVPGMCLSEGGQSATGKLMDHMIEGHAAYSALVKEKSHMEGGDSMSSYEFLNRYLVQLAEKNNSCDVATLTHNLHVWPDFHGNRSPLADSTLKGMVSGLSLSSGLDDLALLYLATLQALVYGMKLTIDVMVKSGHRFSVLLACGGISKNPLFVQTIADVMALPVVIPSASEAVLLGAAMLGARASNDFTSIQDAMQAMGGDGAIIRPNTTIQSYHTKKFDVFEKMLDHQRQYAEMMNAEELPAK